MPHQGLEVRVYHGVVFAQSTQIVVDHFHVIEHVMKAFKKIVSSWAHKKEGKPLLQGKQHLFLTAQEDLAEEQTQERKMIGTQLPLLEAPGNSKWRARHI